MKKLKKLTREQKKIVSDQGLDPKEFLSERDTPEIFIFGSMFTELTLMVQPSTLAAPLFDAQ